MKSQFADKFNHDDEAAGYDSAVLDETNPIRTGYDAALCWVVERAAPGPSSAVLDLGTGTGNLAARLPVVGTLTCVDVSSEMLRLATAKLASPKSVLFVQADLLEYVCDSSQRFDVVISTYAIHHLTEPEKMLLIDRVAAMLVPGGVAVFGDLMFENDAARTKFLDTCRTSGRPALADDIEDEFFWNVESAGQWLCDAGLTVETERISELSWGIAARRAEA